MLMLWFNPAGVVSERIKRAKSFFFAKRKSIKLAHPMS
jgi:hypothetical protein